MHESTKSFQKILENYQNFSVNNVVNRLHNGQTASTRAKAADHPPAKYSGGGGSLMTSSWRGGRLPEPASSSRLKLAAVPPASSDNSQER